ncbi:hypothetical protein [Paractinoplanes lichenicola]|uniref:Uncharacterized protein n=1 Tax=Paractinoplanes lichenicola TaxID=2802976 RepID=A0ABS1W234_9ACTN|nr:hypothetical protein [Actinoplanes lichenicola]MBL7260805.1 hypothetical protein [Actinoplanes lichenicola]
MKERREGRVGTVSGLALLAGGTALAASVGGDHQSLSATLLLGTLTLGLGHSLLDEIKRQARRASNGWSRSDTTNAVLLGVWAEFALIASILVLNTSATRAVGLVLAVSYAAACGYFVTERRRSIAAASPTATQDAQDAQITRATQDAQATRATQDAQATQATQATHAEAAAQAAEVAAPSDPTVHATGPSDTNVDATFPSNPAALSEAGVEEHFPTTADLGVISPPSPTSTADLSDSGHPDRSPHTPPPADDALGAVLQPRHATGIGHAPTAAHVLTAQRPAPIRQATKSTSTTTAPHTLPAARAAATTTDAPTRAATRHAPAPTSPATRAAATHTPSTDRPATQATSTHTPSAHAHAATTRTPSTHAPAKHAPSTHAPSTHAPSTHAPSTHAHAATTHLPSTHASATHASATHASATHASATHAATTHAATKQAPAATHAPSRHTRPVSPSQAAHGRPASRSHAVHSHPASDSQTAHDHPPSLPTGHDRPVAHAPAAHILASASDTAEATNAL